MPLLASTLGLTVPEYGYVLAVGISASLVNFWHGLVVSKARKEAGIAYPSAYATAEEAEKSLAAKKFNCAQRAHTTYLENLPTALVLLGIAGLRFPIYAAVSGAVWVIGRIVYAQGYATGVPAKRQRGNFQYFGLLALLGMSVWTSYKMIAGDF